MDSCFVQNKDHINLWSVCLTEEEGGIFRVLIQQCIWGTEPLIEMDVSTTNI